ncbi:hypothetical protein [Deinococcus sp.]|uniref:hypothetical protein n=1 Tax=Deinococcus sp. TaxID=47478 RepID=UPI00286D8BE2|nr:hypothetical protein [Deinococcus sp.]
MLLAIVGVTHPHHLNPDTASYWKNMHVGLLLLFPLLGLDLWWVLQGVRHPLAWAARVLAFVYAGFYGALDVLAGIATGLMVEQATATGQPGLTSVNEWLFDEGNALAVIGVWAFFAACLLVVISVYLHGVRSWRLILGGVLLMAGAWMFLSSHIYFPLGVIAMLLLAGGFSLLVWARGATEHSEVRVRTQRVIPSVHPSTPPQSGGCRHRWPGLRTRTSRCRCRAAPRGPGRQGRTGPRRSEPWRAGWPSSDSASRPAEHGRVGRLGCGPARGSGAGPGRRWRRSGRWPPRR